MKATEERKPKSSDAIPATAPFLNITADDIKNQHSAIDRVQDAYRLKHWTRPACVDELKKVLLSDPMQKRAKALTYDPNAPVTLGKKSRSDVIIDTLIREAADHLVSKAPKA